MAITITVANQKGGVGKTSTCLALSAGLVDKGYHVLTLDLDPQCNLSYVFDANMDKTTIYDVLTTTDISVADAIQHTQMGDMIPADTQLSVIEVVLKEMGKEYRLKERLEPVQSMYDFIVLDTPPSLSLLTLLALTASRYVIVTAQADAFSLQGIAQLQKTLESVQKYTNSELIVLGILLTRFRTRATFSASYADVAEQLAKMINTKIFDSRIREAIAVQEAEDKKVPIFSYAPRSNVVKDYNEFVDEFLKEVK